eukprot:scaffold11115_cov98-Isochrysis_galbana.AAC.2
MGLLYAPRPGGTKKQNYAKTKPQGGGRTDHVHCTIFSCSQSRFFTPPRPVEGPEELNFAEGRRGSPGFGRGEGGRGRDRQYPFWNFSVGTHFGR